jgi:hypothetical protein
VRGTFEERKKRLERLGAAIKVKRIEIAVVADVILDHHVLLRPLVRLAVALPVIVLLPGCPLMPARKLSDAIHGRPISPLLIYKALGILNGG